ncbi:hypothetical protein PENTCL1PPCAC_25869, partial [Pristionchus entomophagus]
GVEAKRDLWKQFWPVFKETIKEIAMNKYSGKAIYSIAKSMEHLGLEGITEEDSAEIIELILYEVEAVKMRKMQKQEKKCEDSKVRSSERKEWVERDDEWKRLETEAIILGDSFVMKDLGLPEYEGMEKP